MDMRRDRRRCGAFMTWGLLGVAALLGLLAPRPARAQTAAAVVRAQVNYSQLPLAFEANRGQTAGPVQFLARGQGYTLWLTPTEAVLTFARHGRSSTSAAATEQAHAPVVRMTLLGAHPAPHVTGMEALPGKVHYLRGRDSAQWQTQVPTFAKVRYEGVYPGIDLLYYGTHGQFEFDFVVAPGADPTRIQLGLQGADRVDVDAQGDLRLGIGGGELRLHQPRIYQDGDRGTRVITGRYVVLPPPADMGPRAGVHHVGIRVDAYDPTKPLIIDPVLSYATYLGGGADDAGRGIAVDATGAVYLVGETRSADFPSSPEAVQPELRGARDVFVAKLTPDGTALVYATYLGGTADDLGRGIAVDAAGAAYIIGETASADFPTTPGAIQATFGGGTEDAFVAKLAPDGAALAYATYLGGSGFDDGRAIAVDTTGAAYVTGSASAGFPTTAGAVQPTLHGLRDAFVAKLTPDGTALVYGTYMGGGGAEWGSGITIDVTGAAYIAGETTSADFPVTPGVLQPTYGGGTDAFVTKLAPDGAALVYATYLGGSQFDSGVGIAIDATGAAYVTGTTGFFGATNNFPTTPGAAQPTFGGVQDAFVAKLTPDGTALVYATYLGGSRSDGGQGIAIDPAGAAYVMGITDSTDFPTTPDAIQPTSGGQADSFLLTLTPDGAAFFFSTYLGGSGADLGQGISGNTMALDTAGAVYVTWGTNSPDFPTTPGAFQPTLGGGTDAFLVKIAFQPPAGDVVAIRQAIFVDPLALLFVVATSSAAPDAELSVTVPDCLMHVPMSRIKDRYLLVRTVPECGDLDGQTATVTSSRGGSASTPLR